MVVGSGMLAKAFDHFKDDPNVIIFASGVSNSSEDNPVAFEREKNLLKSFAETTAKLVYFSTISVEDPSLKDSSYVKHKLEIESLIKEYISSHVIFRLPNLVGVSANPHTLTNFIYQRIKNNLPVPVFTLARRYLMDVEDVRRLLSPLILDHSFTNRVENIFFDRDVSPMEVVMIFERILNRKAQVVSIEKGDRYHPDNDFFLNYIESIGFHVPADYCELILTKYYR